MYKGLFEQSVGPLLFYVNYRKVAVGSHKASAPSSLRAGNLLHREKEPHLWVLGTCVGH